LLQFVQFEVRQPAKFNGFFCGPMANVLRNDFFLYKATHLPIAAANVYIYIAHLSKLDFVKNVSCHDV